MRNIVKPNVRIQDLTKDYLLCKDCEQLFSDFEKSFADRIFYPFHTKEQTNFEYNTWLKKFAISLNWRVAISNLNNSIKVEHPDYILLQETLETWRKYLLDEITDPGPSEHHILFLGLKKLDDFNKVWSTTEDRFMNMRLLRSVDFCVTTDAQNRLFIYTSIAGIAFISHIHPYSFKDWSNQSKIKNIGKTKTLQKNEDTTFGEFISERLSMSNYRII